MSKTEEVSNDNFVVGFMFLRFDIKMCDLCQICTNLEMKVEFRYLYARGKIELYQTLF